MQQPIFQQNYPQQQFQGFQPIQQMHPAPFQYPASQPLYSNPNPPQNFAPSLNSSNNAAPSFQAKTSLEEMKKMIADATATLAARNEALEKEIEEKNARIKDLELECDQGIMRQRLTAEMQECERLREENSSLQQKQSDYDRLQETLLAFEEQNEQLQKALRDAKQDAGEACFAQELQIKEMGKKIEEYLAKNEELESQIDEAGTMVLNLEAEAKQREEVIEGLRDDITALKKGEVDALEAKIRALEEEVSHLVAENEECVAKWKNIRAKNDELEVFNSTVKDQHLEVDKKWEQKYGSLLGSVEDLKSELAKEKNSHEEAKEHLASLQDKVRKMEVFNLDIMKAHDSDDLLAVVQKIQAQVLVRDADLEEKVSEIADLRSVVAGKEATLNKLLAENEALRKLLAEKGVVLPPDFLNQREDLQLDVVQENLELTKKLECEKDIVQSLEKERHHLLEKLRQRACDPAFDDVDESIRVEYMKLQEEVDRMKEHESRLVEDNKMLKVANETLKNTMAVDGMKELMETMMTQFQDAPQVAVSQTLQDWEEETTFVEPDVMRPSADDEKFASSSLGVHCAHELIAAEAQIRDLTESLHEYESKMQIMSGSMGQLYQEHNAVLVEKENRISELQIDIERLQQINDELEGRLEKEATVDDLLNSSNADIVKKIKEITNENFILTVNEKMLARRFKSIQHELEMRDDFTTKVQKDAAEMEQVLKDRICVLENGLKLQRNHYNLLNEQFKDSVPKLKFTEVENSSQLYREEVERLTIQVSDLQVKAAKYCHTERKLHHQEDLVSQLTLKLGMCEAELEKKREAFEKMRNSGEDNPIPSLLGEIANLETQVEQLKQKYSRGETQVEIATQNLANAEDQVDELTARLSELERKFQTLNQEHLEAKTKLGNCVSVELSESLEKRVRQLDKELMEAKNQASQFKELSQIASNQAKQLNSVIKSNSITLQIVTSKSTPDEVALKLLHLGFEDREESMVYDVPTQLKTVFMKLIDRSEYRDMIQAFEEKSQDELLIGKLHKSLQHVKSLEARNRTECINARNEANALQVKVMKLHQQIQGKEERIIQLEKDHRLKELALKASIDTLRHQNSGLTPKEIAILRRTNEDLMNTLLQEQDLAEKEKQGHSRALLMIRELQEKIESYKRIDDALENFQEENLILAKIKEWNEKLQEKSLDNARLEFQIDGLNDKIEFLTKRCRKYESEVMQLKEKESIQNISQDKANEHLTKTFFEELKRYKEFQTERDVPLETEDSEDKATEMEASMERIWAKQQEHLTRVEAENQQLKAVLQERNETVSLLQKEYEHQIDEKHRIAIDERETILATAREQITNMRDQLEMKNELIKQYKEMIDGLNLKHRSSLMSAQQEISRLNEIILNSQDIDMDQLQAAVNVIDASPKLPQGLVTQETVDEILEDRNLQMTVLVEENEHLQHLIADLREQILLKAQQIEDLSKNFEFVEKHSKETEILAKKLRRDLNDKERRQKQLSKTILDLKQKLLEVAENQERRPLTPPVQDNNEEDFHKRLEAQKTRSEKRIRTLRAKISKLESELEYEKSSNIDSIRELSSKNVGLKNQLTKKENHNNRLHENNVKLTQDKRKLQEKYSKLMKSHRKEIAKLKSEKKERDSAESDVSLNVSTQSTPEQTPQPTKQKKNDEAFAWWTEKKKLRKTIENLKKKLEARTKQCDDLKARAVSLEDDMGRLEKAKSDIEKLCEKYRIQSEKQFSIDEAYEIVKYNHQLNQAKEDVVRLQRVISVEKESEIVNLKMQVEKLRKQKDLQKAPIREFKTPAEQNRYVEQILDDKENLEKQLEDLEKSMLQANVKNLELQFEVDTHSTVQQQLRTRIELLEGTLDRLKQEEEKKRKGGVPKDQESMRKLILNLKELATRQKNEIENMKRNQVSNAKHMAIVKENRVMKSKIKEYEKCPIKADELEKMEAEMAELKEEINRLTNINKQVRRNLTREIDAAAKRKRKLEELEKEKIRLEDQMKDKDGECEDKIKEMKLELYREKKMLEMDMKANSRKRDIKSKEIKQVKSHNEKLKQELKSLLALTENQKQQLLASEELRTKQREKIDQQINQYAELEKQAEKLRQSDTVQKVESLREENIALRAELSAFDSQFFDEIEDLKYREKQQREFNQELQDQLLLYQNQFSSV